MKQYKNTGVMYASSSALGKAVADGNEKLAKTIFQETTNAFERTVPNVEDRAWLMNVSKNGVQAAKL